MRSISVSTTSTATANGVSAMRAATSLFAAWMPRRINCQGEPSRLITDQQGIEKNIAMTADRRIEQRRDIFELLVGEIADGRRQPRGDHAERIAHFQDRGDLAHVLDGVRRSDLAGEAPMRFSSVRAAPRTSRMRCSVRSWNARATCSAPFFSLAASSRLT